MLILARLYEEGRKEINEALEQLQSIVPADVEEKDSINECYFYCYRYLGISYQRDESWEFPQNIQKAKDFFQKADSYVVFFDHNEAKQRELQARIRGNFGNLALEEGKYSEALEEYYESHRLFLDIGDREHIGIAKLKIARALISIGENIEETISFLEKAYSIFIDIGWLEGQARVMEQYVIIYEHIMVGESCLPHHQKEEYIQKSLDYARRSIALFTQIGLERDVGRVEAIKNNVERIKYMTQKEVRKD